MIDEQRDRDEQLALARSELLRGRILAILNEPGERWAEQPLIAGHGLARTLGDLLAWVVLHDGSRLGWATDLLGMVREHVEAAAVQAVGPQERRH